MKEQENIQESAKLSVDQVIDLIRSIRNDLVKDLLKEENLKLFFADHYKKDLSVVKIEFLKRELRELLISPVDLTHYSTLIKQIIESNTASISERNHELFYKELESIFKKYNY